MSGLAIELNAKQRFDRMSPAERDAFLFGMEVAAQLADTLGGDRAEKPSQPAHTSKHWRVEWTIYSQRLRARMIARVCRGVAKQFLEPAPLTGDASP